MTATVLAPAGGVEHSGGALERDGDVVTLAPLASGALPTGADLDPSGPCDWTPHAALLCRAST